METSDSVTNSPSDPALRPVSARNWPVPPTPLVGRTEELLEIERRLDDRSIRFLTLTGPGGVGKTRLALAVIERMRARYGERIWFVPLAAISEPELAPKSVAWALTNREPESRSALSVIASAIGSEPALLVLDNFEQVMAAAGFVGELLGACSGMQIIITSRESLRLRSEQVISVLPLSLPGESGPTVSGQNVSDAMSLFANCVQSIRPGFAPTDDDWEVIAEICRRLDGLPLAIELAAARCRALSPRALLQRLNAPLAMLGQGPRDLPPRQRTMRTAIAWSYDLLNEQDRAVFRRLSVFAGAFTLDAAESVLASNGDEQLAIPIDRLYVLEGVSSLLDKNLLGDRTGTNGEQRFRMLQTIQEFAAEECRSAGEDEFLRNRHARWCAERAELSWRRIYRDDFDTSIFSELEEEHDDIRAALVWLEKRGEGLRMLQLAADMSAFWFFHSHRGEGLSWIARARTLTSGGELPASLDAKALHFQGLMMPPSEQSTVPLQKSIEIWDSIGDPWGVASSSIPLALILNALGRHAEAIPFAELSVSYFRNLDDVWFGSCSLELGLALFGLGRIPEARENLEHAISAGRVTGDWYGAGLASNALGILHVDSVDLASARTALTEATHFWQKLGMMEGFAGATFAIAIFAAAARDHVRAARLLGAAESIAERVEYRPTHIESVRIGRTRANCIDRLGAEFEFEFKRGGALSLTETMRLAHEVLADSAIARATQSTSTSKHGLTPREVEVLRLLAQGKSDREIADQLYISRLTVARHIANIFSKIDVRTRTAAAAYAFRQGHAGAETNPGNGL